MRIIVRAEPGDFISLPADRPGVFHQGWLKAKLEEESDERPVSVHVSLNPGVLQTDDALAVRAIMYHEAFEGLCRQVREGRVASDVTIVPTRVKESTGHRQLLVARECEIEVEPRRKGGESTG